MSGVHGAEMSIQQILDEEIEARVESMAVTDDIAAEERVRTALEDIVGLYAEDHGCETPAEIYRWNEVRRAARARLNTDADGRPIKKRIRPQYVGFSNPKRKQP